MEIKRALDERDWNKAQLAKELGVSRTTVTNLLEKAPETRGSALVKLASDLLGVAHPEYVDARERDAVDDLRALRENWPEEYDRQTSRLRAAAAKVAPPKK